MFAGVGAIQQIQLACDIVLWLTITVHQALRGFTMRSIRLLLLLMMLSTAAFAQSDAQKTFEKLKALSGTWEGKVTMDMPVPEAAEHSDMPCHASHDFERKCGNARDDVGGSRGSGHDVLHGRGPTPPDTLLR